ncbi:MAG: methyltransferase domain-containing protein [Candidatus Dormibacteraeota bacterium]|nr:methyltransferase domain-containing protein [Candidatus Dormibacteraeota bacterium]MBV9526175.1 methyltransferase domain-containing protein [Candidatus Dormibacteraeota bacterium]
MTDAWDPQQYERFRGEREQPFWDLATLVRRRGGRVADLGCGTGRLTVELHRALQARDTIGIDCSPAMLERATGLHAQDVRFERADISTWTPGTAFDVVFSNAALQWLPDHDALLTRIGAWVAPGGELAVQMPANFDHPSHIAAAEVAGEEPFAAAMGGYVREVSVLSPERYAELLHALGFVEQHVRMQVYAHVLDSTDSVVEWVRGTLLTDYEARMPAGLYAEFVRRYGERLRDMVGEQRPYLYPFKRILMWGRAPG